MDNGNNGQILIQEMGLAICLPWRVNDLHTPEWSLCFALQNYPLNVQRYYLTCKGKPIAEARTTLVKTALQNKVKYIWFLDYDVAPPLITTKRLMYDLEQADDDVMIAAGIYTTKEPMNEPMVWLDDGAGVHWKWKYGEVFECNRIGTGCMMIRAELFKTLPEPWFAQVDELNVSRETPEAVTVTDDIFFCKKVREAGYKILADGNVICIHWDTRVSPPRPYTLAPDSYPLKGIQREQAQSGQKQGVMP
jgi:hypothetical protein